MPSFIPGMHKISKHTGARIREGYVIFLRGFDASTLWRNIHSYENLFEKNGVSYESSIVKAHKLLRSSSIIRIVYSLFYCIVKWTKKKSCPEMWERRGEEGRGERLIRIMPQTNSLFRNNIPNSSSTISKTIPLSYKTRNKFCPHC